MVSIGDWAAIGSGTGTFLLAAAAFWQILQSRGLIASARKEAEAVGEQARTAQETAMQNRHLIEAAEEQARAAAQMLREVQLDRELGWRPWLTMRSHRDPTFARIEIAEEIQSAVQFAGSTDDGLLPLEHCMDVCIANIGRGPALHCRYVAYFSIPDEQARATLGLPGRDQRFVGGREYYTSRTFSLGANTEIDLHPTRAAAGTHVTGAIGGTDWQGRSASVHVMLCVDQFGRKHRFVWGNVLPDTWPPLPKPVGTPPTNEPGWTVAVDWIQD